MSVLRKAAIVVTLPLAALILAGTIGARVDDATDQTLRELKVFSETLLLTSRNYVEEVEFGKLERGALQGLAESLDPWSSYYDPARMKQIATGDRSGDVGILLLKHPQQYVRAVVVIPGSPAAAADIARGAYIETIDGNSTKDLALLEAQALLAGAPGTSVKLGFFRRDEDEAGRVLELTRRDLASLRVNSEKRGEDAVVVRVTDVRTGVADLVRREIDKAAEQGVPGIILDLRESTGGSPEEAARLASLFVKPGSLFQRKTREGSRPLISETGPAWTGKLVALIGRGTVGEAELVAEALRVQRGTALIGQPTLGKTTQQELIVLEDGSGLLMSTGEYLRADGTSFGDDGVQPDEKVARHAEPPVPATQGLGQAPVGEPEPGHDAEAEANADGPSLPGEAKKPTASDRDLQLERALELLRAQVAGKAA